MFVPNDRKKVLLIRSSGAFCNQKRLTYLRNCVVKVIAFMEYNYFMVNKSQDSKIESYCFKVEKIIKVGIVVFI